MKATNTKTVETATATIIYTLATPTKKCIELGWEGLIKIVRTCKMTGNITKTNSYFSGNSIEDYRNCAEWESYTYYSKFIPKK